MHNNRKFLQPALLAPAESLTGAQAAVPWYRRSYRRHFFDMHIPDWNPEFLSRLDPEQLVDNLLAENVTAVYFMFLTHTGLAYYPTKVGRMHPNLHGRDILRELIDAAHRKKLDVIAYYCLLFTDWYSNTHPESRAVSVETETGSSQQHTRPICPNNEAYRRFMVDQLTEICIDYSFEGVWPDMTWFPTVCYCQSCKKRYSEEIGGSIPVKVDWQDPVWVRFQRKRQDWLVEFAHLVTSTIRKLRPEVTVVHQSGQLAWGDWRMAGSAQLAAVTDWLSADLYYDRMTQSYFHKLFYSLSRLKPFEHVMGWNMPTMMEHVLVRTEEDLRCRTFSAFMNNGAMTFLESIDPLGTVNRDKYVAAGRVFRELEKFERFTGGEFRQDIAIYHSYDSPPASLSTFPHPASRSDGQEQSLPGDHRAGCVAAARTLLQHHFPFGAISRLNLEQLPHYQLVILPNLVMMSDQEAAAFRQYVQNGGCLYASKFTSILTTDGRKLDNFLLSDVLGVSYTGETSQKVTYVEPRDAYKELFLPFKTGYPATLKDSQALVRLNPGAEVLATITLPYRSNEGGRGTVLTDPPAPTTSHPSLVLNRYGKGCALYSAGAIENWDYDSQRALFAKLLRLMAPRLFSFQVEAPKPVEVTVLDQPDRNQSVIHLLNYQQELPNIPVEGIQIALRLDGKIPKDLVVIPDSQLVPFNIQGNFVEFVAPRLETYCMLVLSYQ